LGRLMGLEPTTPGITRKVSKLLEIVVVRVGKGVPEVTPHIHHRPRVTWAVPGPVGRAGSCPGQGVYFTVNANVVLLNSVWSALKERSL
jgi:hypothetical protein